MNSLYNKEFVIKIRNKYRKNIKNKYGMVGENLQRCHIFGIREAKYLELVLSLDKIDVLVNILVCPQNTLFLSNENHRNFEQNKLQLENLNLTQIQKTLLECAILIKSTKFRTHNKNIAQKVYLILTNIQCYN